LSFGKRKKSHGLRLYIHIYIYIYIWGSGIAPSTQELDYGHYGLNICVTEVLFPAGEQIYPFSKSHPVSLTRGRVAFTPPPPGGKAAMSLS